MVGPVGQHGRDEGAQVLAGRALADEDPHPLAALLLGLGQFGALVIRLHPGGQIGVEGGPETPGAWPSTRRLPGGGDAGQHLGVAGDDPGEVHDLGHPDGVVLLHEGGHVGGEQLGPRALERGGRHAAAGAHAEGEGQPAGRLDQGGHAGDAEHVGHLVGIGRHGRRPQRQHGAHELVDPELGRLEVHVGVHQPGGHGRAVEVDHLGRLPRAPSGHHAVGHGQVGDHPLPGRGRQDPAAAQEQVGRLVAAGHGQDTGRGRCASHGACVAASSPVADRQRQPTVRPWRRDTAQAAWQDRSMLTLRPMTDADVAGAVAAFDSGFLAMRARYGLPVTANSLQNERRRQNRTRHFLPPTRGLVGGRRRGDHCGDVPVLRARASLAVQSGDGARHAEPAGPFCRAAGSAEAAASSGRWSSPATGPGAEGVVEVDGPRFQSSTSHSTRPSVRDRRWARRARPWPWPRWAGRT